MRRAVTFLLLGFFAALVSPSTEAAESFVVLATTTSAENSGLLAHILPRFTAKTGIRVRVVAVGTGQAIRLARNGDADLLLGHHHAGEERLVAQGYGLSRHEVMYNDFVLVGPASDPARVRGSRSAREAFVRIGQAKALFVSRGDESGTHEAERALWQGTGVDLEAASGTWYRELGAGMGATLNVAVALGAYTLADRATWLAFANKGPLAIVLEGDPAFFNQYAVVLLDPRRHPHVKATEARGLADWLLSAEGQTAIASFTIADQQVFFPNASRPAR